MPIFPYRMAQNSQMRQLQALLTYMHTLQVLLYPLRPPKYVKYTATMTYGNWPTALLFIISSSSSSVELAYRQSGTSNLDGFYIKRLLSIACVILDQENLRNFTQNCIIKTFPYLLEAIFCTCICIPHFIERWGSSVHVSSGVEGGETCAITSK